MKFSEVSSLLGPNMLTGAPLVCCLWLSIMLQDYEHPRVNEGQRNEGARATVTISCAVKRQLAWFMGFRGDFPYFEALVCQDTLCNPERGGSRPGLQRPES